MKNIKIIKELERVAAQNRGLLLPEQVVEAARPQRSVLHSRFTWDNTEAAHQHRLWQARQLISICVEVLPGSKEESPVFVSLSPDRHTGQGYRALVSVMSKQEEREQLLRDALSDMNRFQQRYRQLRELAQVFAEIKKVRRKAA